MNRRSARAAAGVVATAVSGWLHEQLAQANPDLLRAMVSTFAEALMGTEADAVVLCGCVGGQGGLPTC